jgi:hypothetical protein
MTVDIWSSTEARGVEVAGTLRLHRGKISVEVTPGYAIMMQNVMGHVTIRGLGGKPFDRETDPEGWLKALPIFYHGTYIWARLRKEE